IAALRFALSRRKPDYLGCTRRTTERHGKRPNRAKVRPFADPGRTIVDHWRSGAVDQRREPVDSGPEGAIRGDVLCSVNRFRTITGMQSSDAICIIFDRTEIGEVRPGYRR